MSRENNENNTTNIKIITDLDISAQDIDLLLHNYNEEIDKLEYEITQLIIELFIMEKTIQRLIGEKEYISLLKSGTEWYAPLSEN